MKPTIITLSRQVCTGGCDVGKRAAEALGIPYYDKELIQMAARATGLPEQTVAASEQRPTSSMLYDLYSMSMQAPLGDQVFMAQARVIKELAGKGPCVIVGRCADYLLQGRQGLLRVLIHAPIEYRRAYARAALGWEGDDKAVDTRMRKEQKTREKYYECYTPNRWGDVENYDLVLNAALGVEACTDALLALCRAGEGKA